MNKRVLDEATRALLHGIAPFSSSSSLLFTPPVYDRMQLQKDLRPVFKIRGLTIEEGAELDSLMEQAALAKSSDWNSKVFDLCRKLVIGWEQIFDIGTGEEMTYAADPQGGADTKLWAAQPVVNKSAIFSKVMQLHGLVDVEKLGLASLPQSTQS